MSEVINLSWQTLADCETCAQAIAKRIHGGQSLGLVGGLGAGKTTFMRFLLSALGSEDAVSSPTFVLEHQYSYPAGVVEHWDLYRLQEMPEELYEPVAKTDIRCLEWVDKFPELMSSVDILLEISLTHKQDEILRNVSVTFRA